MGNESKTGKYEKHFFRDVVRGAMKAEIKKPIYFLEVSLASKYRASNLKDDGLAT